REGLTELLATGNGRLRSMAERDEITIEAPTLSSIGRQKSSRI
ncbi:MAG: hypothetical protein JWN63_3055, partial [Candidatus Acidoferrum typicum]|nr:hypothetical protein [Candidatus Acidoferrum typicum]